MTVGNGRLFGILNTYIVTMYILALVGFSLLPVSHAVLPQSWPTPFYGEAAHSNQPKYDNTRLKPIEESWYH